MCLSQTDLVYLDFILIPRLCSSRLSQESLWFYQDHSTSVGPELYLMNLQSIVFFSCSILLFWNYKTSERLKQPQMLVTALNVYPCFSWVNFTLIWQMSDAKKKFAFAFCLLFSLSTTEELLQNSSTLLFSQVEFFLSHFTHTIFFS